jgi:hypothetical protein
MSVCFCRHGKAVGEREIARMRMASAAEKTALMQRSSTCSLSLALLAWPGASILACPYGQQAGACLHGWRQTHSTLHTGYIVTTVAVARAWDADAERRRGAR